MSICRCIPETIFYKRILQPLVQRLLHRKSYDRSFLRKPLRGITDDLPVEITLTSSSSAYGKQFFKWRGRFQHKRNAIRCFSSPRERVGRIRLTRGLRYSLHLSL